MSRTLWIVAGFALTLGVVTVQVTLMVLEAELSRLREAHRECARLQQALNEVKRWFRTTPWLGVPDAGSHGGHPYTVYEVEKLGYGTYRDERFLPAALAGPDTPADSHRLDNAQARASEAAAEWCWHATPESEKALRDAVAEWRTALGLWRLANRDTPADSQEDKT